jgi:hypothetical protein
MEFTSKTIAVSAPEWDAQRKRIRLSRALLGGTSAMQKAGIEYLPVRADETAEEYADRISRSVLVNYFKMTTNYLAGQVFQKQASYEKEGEGEAPEYNSAFFDLFKENTDTQGTNLTLFCEQVFREGLTDGVAFILSDYPHIQLSKDEGGRTLYKDAAGEWKPRTAQADAENGWRPYWVLIKASQVLDAWLDSSGGKTVLRAFRYVETLQREKEDGTRETVKRIRAISPDQWEVWEATKDGEYERKDGGKNSLGVVPVDWFMPGEQVGATEDNEGTPGLTAIPALDDLAEMNRAHWQGYSDHKGLMAYGRAPVWLLKMLGIDPNKPIKFGPGRSCSTDNPDADIQSKGVDPASIDRSFQDLKGMEDYMGLYGLQLIMPKNAGVTATQAQISAASSDATLKGWVQKLKDCMENALRKIALWQGGKDGPALFINQEFRIPYSEAITQHLAGLVEKGLFSLRAFFETLKKMGLYEDTDFEGYKQELQETRAFLRENQLTEFTPGFGRFPEDGQHNTQ